MAKKWTQGKYGFETLELGLVTLEVGWGSARGDKYVARLSSGQYKAGFESKDPAKAWAEGEARRLLAKAMRALGAEVQS